VRPRVWSSELAKEWLATHPEADGVYHADGHVRVYHRKLAALPRRGWGGTKNAAAPLARYRASARCTATLGMPNARRMSPWVALPLTTSWLVKRRKAARSTFHLCY
jgi:hypothetical protein